MDCKIRRTLRYPTEEEEPTSRSSSEKTGSWTFFGGKPRRKRAKFIRARRRISEREGQARAIGEPRWLRRECQRRTNRR